MEIGKNLSELFARLADLNTHLSIILGIHDAQRVKVLVLDSGTNLLVGAKMATGVGKNVKQLFIEIWDKIKYGKFEDFDRKVESLSKGLTLAATIQQQIDNKVIDEETGNNLKYRVLDDMTSLISIGAMLPAEEISEKVDRKKLLAEKRGIRLLGSGE